MYRSDDTPGKILLALALFIALLIVYSLVKKSQKKKEDEKRSLGSDYEEYSFHRKAADSDKKDTDKKESDSDVSIKYGRGFGKKTTPIKKEEKPKETEKFLVRTNAKYDKKTCPVCGVENKPDADNCELCDKRL
ncbi:MAG: hypothetical protein Q4B57_08920 [Eubacteriales bacterium]|nr:hypothetical protein [Eubacteriales bacterium]